MAHARHMPGDFSFSDVKTKLRLRCYASQEGRPLQWSNHMRSLIALVAAAFIGLAFTPSDASARPFGGGHGFHGGHAFHGGGGFRGGFGHGGFRHGGFRGFGPLVGVGVGLGLASSYPYWGYSSYGYGDGCLVPRRVWTPWGPRTRWINVCY